MIEPSNPRRPKRGTWTPQPETLALLRDSGNSINGVGETAPRQTFSVFLASAGSASLGRSATPGAQELAQMPWIDRSISGSLHLSRTDTCCRNA